MRNEHKSTIWSALAVVALLGAVSTGCSPARAHCQKREECTKDPKSEDFVNVCTAEYEAEQERLRANEAEKCIVLANARDALAACQASLECIDFSERDNNSRCEDEREAYREALEDTTLDLGAVGECGWLRFDVRLTSFL